MKLPPGPARVAIAAAIAMVVGCSSPRPWINTALEPGESITYDGRAQMFDPSRAPDLLVVTSLSGGGSRAAAFAHAVIAELDATPFSWRGRETTLAREIDLVIGVSGGSVAAAHMALHGVGDHLSRFPADFLQVDFQSRLWQAALAPQGLARLGSPDFGRGQVLAEELDAALFGGADFGRLAALAGRPYLIVGATDLTSGAEFDFTSDQLELLCSSIDRVPLSFAVAASSSVPLVFSPLTVQNHRDGCPRATTAGQPASPDDNARMRLVKGEFAALASGRRHYVHLIDGGVSDNLGTRRIADYVAQMGGIGAVLSLLDAGADAPTRAPRRIVFVAVDSERRGPLPIDGRGTVPTTLEVLDAMIYGGLGRQSVETSLVFADAVALWRRELRSIASPGSDVDIFSIEVSLSTIDDSALRDRVLAIPTAFRISSEDRALLREAARQGLRQSGDFRRFIESVGASPASLAGGDPGWAAEPRTGTARGSP
jgi:NTE family protein